MPSCVVKTCKNYTSKIKKIQGITYHRFPRNKVQKDEWVQIIRNCRKDNDWKPSTSSTVCSVHFDEADFLWTRKGLRCLVRHAYPKKLLHNVPESQTQINPSFVSVTLEVAVIKEEVLTGYCRLCATLDCNGTLISLQSDDAMKKLVVNMLERLNPNIDFHQEHLPTTVCKACITSLYTAYDFVVGTDLAQSTLYKMSVQKHSNQIADQNVDSKMDISTSSLQIPTNKGPPCDFDQVLLPLLSPAISIQVSPTVEPASIDQPSLPDTSEYPDSESDTKSSIPLLDPPDKRRLKYELNKKIEMIKGYKQKFKILNQKVRRLNKRNEILMNSLKSLKEHAS